MSREAIAALSERQRTYLRLVLHHYNSSEIARQTGASPHAVDKQLKIAMRRLGVQSRFEAARMLAAHANEDQRLDPPDTGPSVPPLFPLPSALPSAGRQRNSLTPGQVVIWGLLIAIGTPIIVIAAAGMIEALTRLFVGSS